MYDVHVLRLEDAVDVVHQALARGDLIVEFLQWTEFDGEPWRKDAMAFPRMATKLRPPTDDERRRRTPYIFRTVADRPD